LEYLLHGRGSALSPTWQVPTREGGRREQKKGQKKKKKVAAYRASHLDADLGCVDEGVVEEVHGGLGLLLRAEADEAEQSRSPIAARFETINK